MRITLGHLLFVLILLFCQLGRRIFFWVTSGYPSIPTMTSLKGQVKYLCGVGRLEKQVKVEFSNVHVSYTLFLPELGILVVEYF